MTAPIQFKITRHGYNQQEVDEYIRILTKEYNNLISELETAKQKADAAEADAEAVETELEELRKELESAAKQKEQEYSEEPYVDNEYEPAEPSDDKSDAISSALIKAELFSQQIMKQADQEAEQIRQAAQDEAEQIRQQANQEVEQMIQMKKDSIAVLKKLYLDIYKIIEGK